MYIKDDRIKEMVHAYQIGRSRATLRDIRDTLSAYIYHYPRKVFNEAHERAIEFYLVVLEDLDRILLRFEKRDYRFLTWFTVVLRNLYLTFIRSRKPQPEATVSLQEPLPSQGRHEKTLEDILPDMRHAPDAFIENDPNVLDTMERIIDEHHITRDGLLFRIHYLEVFRERVITPLMTFFEISFDEAFAKYEEAKRTYLQKYKRIMKLQDTISKLHRRAMECLQKGNEEKANKLFARKQGYVDLLHGVKIVVPYNYLAKMFAITVNAVTKVVQKIHTRLRTLFPQDLV